MLHLNEQELTGLPILCHSRYILRHPARVLPAPGLDEERRLGGVDSLDSRRRVGNRQMDRPYAPGLTDLFRHLHPQTGRSPGGTIGAAASIAVRDSASTYR